MTTGTLSWQDVATTLAACLSLTWLARRRLRQARRPGTGADGPAGRGAKTGAPRCAGCPGCGRGPGEGPGRDGTKASHRREAEPLQQGRVARVFPD